MAIGPSGHNDVYLFHLDTFLSHITQHSSAAALTLKDHSGDDRTGELAKMVKLLQTEYRPYFLFGAGSNEHNQLLMPRVGSASNSSSDGLESDGQIVAKDSLDIKEVHELAEMLLVVPRQCKNDDASSANVNHKPLSLHAGGGHSALLTHGGMLYLWGWNQAGQLGRLGDSFSKSLVEGAALSESSPLAYIPPLSNIKVATVSLGHTHTLVIEKDTGRLFGFGENGRGQVDGFIQGNTPIGSWHKPRTPLSLSEDYFVDAAAGLFHSAAITNEGELVTWGCGRFGQCLQLEETKGEYVSNTTTIGRWKTPDGSKLVHVVCGRRHTAILDELGRVWTLGDNKYGQLGRVESSSTSLSKTPQLVEGPLGQAGSGCFAIMNGWSHILALVRSENSEDITLYGWGRNDKGQLGMRSGKGSITKPTSLSNNSNVSIIQSACCGSESSHVLDVKNNIWGCGWNEHGNLGIGRYHQQDNNDYECCWTLETVTGTRIVAPPPSVGEGRIFAAGGAHLIVMAT